MKVAVIGGGGREHTLAWKLAQSPSVDKLYAIPGSAAMSEVAQCVDIALSDLDAITDYAKNEGIDMLVGRVQSLCQEPHEEIPRPDGSLRLLYRWRSRQGLY